MPAPEQPSLHVGHSDSESRYGAEVPFAFALGYIVARGVREIIAHPAVDEVRLQDGSVVRHWKGGYEHDCSWQIQEASADA